MTEQQPDGLVAALATTLCAADDTNPHAFDGAGIHLRCTYRDMARAVLARTDLVLPAADVIPKRALLAFAASHEHEVLPDCDEVCDGRALVAAELRAIAAGGGS